MGHEVFELKSDLTDFEGICAELEKKTFDYVVHLAAKSSVCSDQYDSYYNTNVVGTLNLLVVLVKLLAKPKKVLLVSTANVYGVTDQSPVSESQPPNPNSHYGVSKYSMELMSKLFIDDLPIVIARPFNYTGKGQSVQFLIPKIVESFVNKNPSISLGNIDVIREFNSVEIICYAYLDLLKFGVEGEVYNICSGVPHTIDGVIKKMSKITNHLIKVEVDNSLIRKNELNVLYGDNSKLKKLITDNGSYLRASSLEETLTKMLINKND